MGIEEASVRDPQRARGSHVNLSGSELPMYTKKDANTNSHSGKTSLCWSTLYTEPGKAAAANPHHDSTPSTGQLAWMARQGKAMTTDTLSGCPGYRLHT